MEFASTQFAATALPRLRPLTGYDERAVDRSDSIAAMDLIARLAKDTASSSVAKLTASQRDSILAAIFSSLYGDRIESTIKCAACGESFEISFRLSSLLEQQQPDVSAALSLNDGTYRMPDGTRFRLPSGEDEAAILDLSADRAMAKLLRLCVVEAPNDVNVFAIQKAMERVAPILDLDIDTSCAECFAPARVHFDLQTYLLQSIVQDRPRLWRETHILATSYKWSLDAIHSLTRADRRALVSMIEADAGRRRAI